MTSREKIIVGLALLSVVYGVYVLVLAPKPGGPLPQATSQERETLNAFITKVAAASQESGLSDADAYIIKTAEAAWTQDPMVVIPKKAAPQPVTPPKAAEPAPTVNLVYTGYMETGEKQLAIINGMEYETGDQVDPGGWLIRNIYPNRIEVIAGEHGGKTFSIPLTETD